MAASGESGTSGSGGSTEEAFMTFYIEVKQIEKRDSVLTSKNQIERLTRPGSSYFNLNPFEVLQIDPEVTDEEIKKRFRQLSILVHPDKNQDDADRAQKAFEAVDKAYKLLLDQEQKKRALDVIQAGKEYVEHTVKERKKQLKKEGKPTIVEEDDPELFKQAVYKQTMKLFAELEIKRKEREAKEMHERKQARAPEGGHVHSHQGHAKHQVPREPRQFETLACPYCFLMGNLLTSYNERYIYRASQGLCEAALLL
ncbi:PREDICTED: dnaJ homolog subfamily C member 8-like [Mandrillus leucophaeus]|uniref:dnaJ homolog subfamily C member 8-like n=1 Tax=Mandrillus leucophaeus TaxID=9568 RepID=UPI0005F54E78|nr:PREDICTED: dnaJ homolog subfamily C member 8-like [Mandrillus leucophaeus]